MLYTRTVALGAVVAAPLMVSVVGHAFRENPVARRTLRGEWLVLGASAAACLTLSAIVLPKTAAAPTRVPVGLDSALEAAPVGSVILNEYGLGGWIYLRHPKLVPVVDERTELYSLSYLDDYLNCRGARSGWEVFQQRTHARYALLPDDSPLGDALRRENGWVIVGKDADYTLLRAPS